MRGRKEGIEKIREKEGEERERKGEKETER